MLKDYLNFYFSFNGRATRYDFNIRYALVAFVGAILTYTADFIRLGGAVFGDPSRLYISNTFSLLAFIAGFAVTCRRLHDMNLSGWWQILIYFVPAGFVGIFFATIGFAIFANPLAAGMGGFIALLIVMFFYLFYFIFLSAKRGTVGPNKYGSDPLQIQTLETIQ
jgi:uncharacterized membrane protein YhaH (DUF805 family)